MPIFCGGGGGDLHGLVLWALHGLGVVCALLYTLCLPSLEGILWQKQRLHEGQGTELPFSDLTPPSKLPTALFSRVNQNEMWAHGSTKVWERRNVQRTSVSGMFLPPWNIGFNRESSFHFCLENKFFLHSLIELVSRQLWLYTSPVSPSALGCLLFYSVAVRDAPTWRKIFLLLYNDD